MTRFYFFIFIGKSIKPYYRFKCVLESSVVIAFVLILCQMGTTTVYNLRIVLILVFFKNGFPNDDISFLFENKYLGKAMMAIFGSELKICC